MRQAKLVVMYSLEYYKFKFRKCLLVADKRLRSGLKTHKHIAPSCLLRLLCFLKFSLFLARVPLYIIRCLPILKVCPSLCLRSLRPIRPLRSPFASLALPSPPSPIRLIRVQKKFLSESCANTSSKLSPALCKPHGKASAIPLKSRKTQIFSNFLSQSLARFRKSPYFCTR